MGDGEPTGEAGCQVSGRAGRKVRPAHARGTQVGTLHLRSHEFSVCRGTPSRATSDGRPGSAGRPQFGPGC